MQRTWVTRRIETFTFLEADTVRRRMSVDFTLPPSSTLSDGDMALVPLMLLTKGTSATSTSATPPGRRCRC